MGLIFPYSVGPLSPRDPTFNSIDVVIDDFSHTHTRQESRLDRHISGYHDMRCYTANQQQTRSNI